MNQLTSDPFHSPYSKTMSQKSCQHLDSMDDLRTDYLLIAMGIAAAVLALGFLLIT